MVTPIIESTKRWSELCYDPTQWMSRANQLGLLGYPELATGDAYKARLLVQAKFDMHKGKSTALGRKVNVPFEDDEKTMDTLRKNILTFLIDSLICLDEPLGTQKLVREARDYYPSDLRFKELSNVAINLLERKRHEIRTQSPSRKPEDLYNPTGHTFQEQYPFISPRHMSRSKDAIYAAQKALEFLSTNCSLAPRTFLNAANSNTEAFGIYATMDVKPGSRLFMDETILGAADTVPSHSLTAGRLEICENCCGSLLLNSTERVKSACCSAVYCSEHCRTTALAFYHQSICGQNYDWLLRSSKGTNSYSKLMTGSLWLRVLATCVQSDCHPLDHPLVARLVPHFHDVSASQWTLRHNIIQPIRILQQLGVDIFQDLRYDTWVLENLGLRLKTNQRSDSTDDDREISAVNYLYSFLNHSCEPNAYWYTANVRDGVTARGSSTIVVVAIKPIRKGEEVCIDYCNVSQIRDRAKRQKKLRTWISNGMCQCTRCQRE